MEWILDAIGDSHHVKTDSLSLKRNESYKKFLGSVCKILSLVWSVLASSTMWRCDCDCDFDPHGHMHNLITKFNSLKPSKLQSPQYIYIHHSLSAFTCVELIFPNYEINLLRNKMKKSITIYMHMLLALMMIRPRLRHSRLLACISLSRSLPATATPSTPLTIFNIASNLRN